MTKAKKITFDPVAHLKTLPQEFWLKVSTYNDRFSDPSLRTHDFDQNGRHFRKRPDACEEFPQYAEFFDKYENITELRPRGWGETPRHDWVEYTIGDFTFRWHARDRMFTHPELDGWKYCSDSYALVYGPEMDGSAVGYEHTEEGKKLHKAYERAEKKVASTWNSLRKKARREAGVEADAKTAKKKEEERKAQEREQAKTECCDHIAALIETLITFQHKVDQEDFTREDVREVFDMTNEMTSQNKKLKDAFGVR